MSARMIRHTLCSLFSAKKGTISSKRVVGVVAWGVVLFVFVYCTIIDIQAPEISYAIITAATALLGVDSVTNIFKHPNKEE